MRQRLTAGPALILVAALLSGCASHHLDAADSAQRAADDLRQAGAGSTTAARDAQAQADQHRQDARCRDFVGCALDVVGQVLLSVVIGTDADRR